MKDYKNRKMTDNERDIEKVAEVCAAIRSELKIVQEKEYIAKKHLDYVIKRSNDFGVDPLRIINITMESKWS